MRHCPADDSVSVGTVFLACFAFHNLAERTKKTDKGMSVEYCNLEFGSGKIGPVHGTDGGRPWSQTQERELWK
jgi:hypothetical protein